MKTPKETAKFLLNNGNTECAPLTKEAFEETVRKVNEIAEKRHSTEEFIPHLVPKFVYDDIQKGGDPLKWICLICLNPPIEPGCIPKWCDCDDPNSHNFKEETADGNNDN